MDHGVEGEAGQAMAGDHDVIMALVVLGVAYRMVEFGPTGWFVGCFISDQPTTIVPLSNPKPYFKH